MFFQSITSIEVFQCIHQLYSNKAIKPNNIPVSYIKTASEVISAPLSEIYNRCVVEGVFPDELKLAKVIPVHKGGSTKKPNNYRPIFFLSTFSKIFETLILQSLDKCVSEFEVLNKNQFGFRKNHSTSLLLADVLSQINKATDDKKYTCMILLDLKKAFDTVNHNTLLKKLETYGIRGNILQLLESYLHKRNQYVFVNNVMSNNQEVKCGIPQGSTLGPTLFSLHINDIASASNFEVRLFADDTALMMQNKNPSKLQEKIKKKLINVELFLRKNKLTLSCDKTTCITFGPGKNCLKAFKLTMNDKPLKQSTVAKYLGIFIDDKLSWAHHVQCLCEKISQKTEIFYKIRIYRSKKSLVSLYYSFIFLQSVDSTKTVHGFGLDEIADFQAALLSAMFCQLLIWICLHIMFLFTTSL